MSSIFKILSISSYLSLNVNVFKRVYKIFPHIYAAIIKIPLLWRDIRFDCRWNEALQSEPGSKCYYKILSYELQNKNIRDLEGKNVLYKDLKKYMQV
jgi:hypothetical protein